MNKQRLTLLILIAAFAFFITNKSLALENDSNLNSDSTITKTLPNPEITDEHLPSVYMIFPFILLLMLIATGPLFYRHVWERHYPKVAITLGAIVVLYYLIMLNDHEHIVESLKEYISFIALLGSLFVASGGILIDVDKKSTPIVNILFLLFGAFLANIISTTGASMVLIRPYLKMNKNRVKAYHVIFFIFLISNIGGALTPIGDPPLFIGFLKGVPFFWVIANVWYIWVPTLIMILAVFFFFDYFNRSNNDLKSNEYSGKIKFKGARNVGYLVIIILSVFIDPGIFKWVPDLSPLPFGIREIIMFAVIYLSYKQADSEILKVNEFDFEPIKEVAYLFIGIFMTMVPALQLIAKEAYINSAKLNAGIFYWATGSLSGVLDNTPTYLNFLSAAVGKYGLDVNVRSQVLEFVNHDQIYLRAISVSAVFFGSMTYIGNGPNFMVKSICERAGIEMPSFFGYIIKYSLPILIPIFVVIWAIFFN